MTKIAGGCLCGAVRYHAETEPAMQAVCHCKTCQVNSGSAFSLNVAVPLDSLTVEGDSLTTYVDRSGASGEAFNRNFCGICGSHLYSSGPAYGELGFIKAGTLDDASWVSPDLHIWCAEKLPWTDIPADATQADGNPG